MAKKKIKVGELTLNQIVEIAEKYQTRCSKCPLYDVKFVNCWAICEANIKRKTEIKKELESEIEVEKDGNTKTTTL